MAKHNTDTAKSVVYTQAGVSHHQELSQRATNSECPHVVPLLLATASIYCFAFQEYSNQLVTVIFEVECFKFLETGKPFTSNKWSMSMIIFRDGRRALLCKLSSTYRRLKMPASINGFQKIKNKNYMLLNIAY